MSPRPLSGAYGSASMMADPPYLQMVHTAEAGSTNASGVDPDRREEGATPAARQRPTRPAGTRPAARRPIRRRRRGAQQPRPRGAGRRDLGETGWSDAGGGFVEPNTSQGRG